jgi:hypothetical protein
MDNEFLQFMSQNTVKVRGLYKRANIVYFQFHLMWVKIREIFIPGVCEENQKGCI